jgi:hypothetical protein
MKKVIINYNFFLIILFLSIAFLCLPINAQDYGIYHSKKVEQAKNLIVKVMGLKQLGAGIIFNISGGTLFIATTNHIVESGIDWVEFKFQANTQIKAQLVTSSPQLDLAVLRVDVKNENRLYDKVMSSVSFDQVGFSSNLSIQDEVYPVGHKGTVNWYVPISNPPKISRIVEEEITIDFTSSPGHSGGGLFNRQWDLVGMMRKTGRYTTEVLSFDRIVKSLESWNYEVSLRNRKDLNTKGQKEPFKNKNDKDAKIDFSHNTGSSGLNLKDRKSLLEYLEEK